ncbi:MAG: hypothetical protein JWO38_7534 [Gemmataceae bacterium]|nr:hypothetical protein [Gemmataceae bacterium]
MRGTGPVGMNGQTVYAYYTRAGDRVRVRISVDENDRLGLVEGLRVAVALPGQKAVDVLVLAASQAPPYVWLELELLSPRAAIPAGLG